MLRHAIAAAALLAVLAGFLGCGGQASRTPATAQEQERPAMKITSSAFAEGATKEELLAAMKGRVLAEAETVGTYER